MRTMAISEFKVHALKVVSDVAETKEIVRITKRGKPIAEVIPYRPEQVPQKPGRLSQFLLHEDDIVSPLGEEPWEACQ